MTNLQDLRIGVVAYVNALPLEYDLLRILPKAEIVHSVPSQLALMLEEGRIDVAMVSSIELVRRPDFRFIPGLGVCCDGPVRSVCLFSRKPPETLETVALDQSSLTSVTLLRILYEDFWKTHPQYVSFAPPVENGLKIADGALSIGDPTFRFNGKDMQVYDMGEMWRQYSGLPFVFAVWITRQGIDPQTLAEPFSAAAESALQKLEELSDYCAQRSEFSSEFYYTYFTECIHYHMTPRDIQGMQLFFEKAKKILP